MCCASLPYWDAINNNAIDRLSLPYHCAIDMLSCRCQRAIDMLPICYRCIMTLRNITSINCQFNQFALICNATNMLSTCYRRTINVLAPIYRRIFNVLSFPLHTLSLCYKYATQTILTLSMRYWDPINLLNACRMLPIRYQYALTTLRNALNAVIN